MKTWMRSAAGFLCGHCGEVLPPGSPVLRLSFHRVRRVKLRCEACADEPVPTDLSSMATRTPLVLTYVDDDGIERPIPPVKPMTKLGSAAPQFDWKQKASGDPSSTPLRRSWTGSGLTAAKRRNATASFGYWNGQARFTACGVSLGFRYSPIGAAFKSQAIQGFMWRITWPISITSIGRRIRSSSRT
jgi:hypothetical protein